MSEIKTGGLSELLRRRLLISGQDQPPNELMDQLIGTLVLENDRPEWSYYKGEKLASAAGTAAAGGAGTYSILSFFNPSTEAQPLIAVVKKIICECPSGSTVVNPVWIHRYDALIGTPITSLGPRDSRWGGSGSQQTPNCQVAIQSNGAVFGTIVALMQRRVHQNTAMVAWEYHEPFVIGPQCGLLVSSSLDLNKDFSFGISWIERRGNQWEASS